MAIRFILGSAGAGKSSYCFESLRSELLREPRRGCKLILLVPEQASLQTERALLASSDIEGVQRAEVLSFRRFAERLLQERPGGPTQILSAVGRSMVLQRLMGELSGQLHYFRATRHLPGLYTQLSLQIEEFITAGVETGDLIPERISQPLAESLQAKLSDLRTLYEAYLKFLEGGFVDPTMRLDHARRMLAASSWVEGARIWVDGFGSFSRQESRFLAELAAHSSQMEISLLIDPQTNGVCNDQPPDPYSLFAPTVTTYHKLLSELRDRRLEIVSPLSLPLKDSRHTTLPTPADHDDLHHLRMNLFRESQPHSAQPSQITLFRASDPREEARQVVRHIVHLTSRPENPLRYRDIAIITRQLGEQHGSLVAELQGGAIPYFIDRRPPLSEHSLHELLSGLLRVEVEGFATDAVRQLLKSDLLGLDRLHIDELENYIIAHQIRGLAAWRGANWKRDPFFRSPFDDPSDDSDVQVVLLRINTTRREFFTRLSPWVLAEQSHTPSHMSGLDWARRLYETLEQLRIAQQIESWAVDADLDGLTAEAAHHRQAWRSVVQLFDDAAIALGSTVMTLVEFSRSFEAGLSQLDTGLVPPAIDQILLGSIERTRHPQCQGTSCMHVAFVLGMNDGTYPLTRSEPQILNDDERRTLVDTGLHIEPPRSARLGEERLLAYIAMTRPAEHLFVSYCEADSDGRKLEPSPYLNDLMRTFPDLTTKETGSCDLAGTLDAVANGRDLVTAITAHFDQKDDRLLWNTLYERARHREDLQQALKKALASLVDNNDAALSIESIESLHSQPMRTSITNLEQYAACPFKYFASVQLRLRPRAEGQLDALKLGSLYHAVLDSFTRQLLQDNVRLGSLTDETLELRLSRSIQKFNESLGEDWAGAWIDEPFLWERLHHELLESLRAQRTIQAAGSTQTIASELCFGIGPSQHSPGLQIDTPKGRRVYLRGKIDRVDVADRPDGDNATGGRVGFVFDYKRSRQRLLNLSEVYHGLSLQLIVYLIGLRKLGTQLTGQPITPAGAFYLPLIPDYTSVDHPDEADDTPIKSFRPRGIFDADAIPDLDTTLATGSSTFVAAILNKDKTLSAKLGNDATHGENLQRLMQHVEQVVGRLCDDILDGKVAVEPYRMLREMPCQYCDYRSVCRFEFPESPVRRIDSIKTAELWSRLKSNG